MIVLVGKLLEHITDYSGLAGIILGVRGPIFNRKLDVMQQVRCKNPPDYLETVFFSVIVTLKRRI